MEEGHQTEVLTEELIPKKSDRVDHMIQFQEGRCETNYYPLRSMPQKGLLLKEAAPRICYII